MKVLNNKIICGIGITLSAFAVFAAIAVPKVQSGELTENQVYSLGIASVSVSGIGLLLLVLGVEDAKKTTIRESIRDALQETKELEADEHR